MDKAELWLGVLPGIGVGRHQEAALDQTMYRAVERHAKRPYHVVILVVAIATAGTVSMGHRLLDRPQVLDALPKGQIGPAIMGDRA